jgi:hypothetical protein
VPPSFYLREETVIGTYCIGGRGGSRATLDVTEKRKISCPYLESKPNILSYLGCEAYAVKNKNRKCMNGDIGFYPTVKLHKKQHFAPS